MSSSGDVGALVPSATLLGCGRCGERCWCNPPPFAILRASASQPHKHMDTLLQVHGVASGQSRNGCPPPGCRLPSWRRSSSPSPTSSLRNQVKMVQFRLTSNMDMFGRTTSYIRRSNPCLGVQPSEHLAAPELTLSTMCPWVRLTGRPPQPAELVVGMRGRYQTARGMSDGFCAIQYYVLGPRLCLEIEKRQRSAQDAMLICAHAHTPHARTHVHTTSLSLHARAQSYNRVGKPPSNANTPGREGMGAPQPARSVCSLALCARDRAHGPSEAAWPALQSTRTLGCQPMQLHVLKKHLPRLLAQQPADRLQWRLSGADPPRIPKCKCGWRLRSTSASAG